MSDGLDGRRIWCGRWADWLGSAMKPLTEYEKNFGLETGSGCAKHKKTHFRVEVGGVRLREFVSVRLHHFHGDSRNRVEYYPVHYASWMSSSGHEAPHTTNAVRLTGGLRVV